MAPTSAAVRPSPARPRAGTLWIAVNALNLADALLSWLVLERGAAVEANPVVSAIGLPGKVVLVAAASALVARLRPGALWVPIAALGAVVIYELLGLAAAPTPL